MAHIVKIGLVVVDEADRLLVVRKQGGATFILPGGKREGDESDIECLIREVREEIQVATENIQPFGTFHAAAADQDGDTVEVRAYTGTLVGDPVPAMEIAEIAWITINDPHVPIAQSISEGIIPAIAANNW